ncbi:MAG: hypothetical protein DRG78_24995 [Epsilonproteobacteria bacterium]|nr:MAG: hypothetical protein DRG78_24995 [Campylobacterota bacterium]
MSFKVYPYIWDKKIGTIIYDEGNIYFEYDDTFRGSGLEISPLKLPLDFKGVYTNNDERYFSGLAGVFHDSLPDKFGTKVIERYFESKGLEAYELNVIQKLMFVGDRGMGAISYRPAEEISDDKNVAEIIDIQKFYENSKKIVTGEAVDVIEEMLEFMESSASAGGARAKAIIGFNPVTNEMTNGTKDTLPDGFEHWLIKFDEEKEGKSLDYTKLEYLYMSMAKECGINVPEIRLFEHGNLNHFLIKRFDRVNNTRMHTHTLAGLTHTDFNVPKHYSYDMLLKLTLNLTGEQAAVEEQFRRMVFNVIARNQDDHAKNFSFMMDQKGRWSITPAYDITYANGAEYTKNHQLSIRGKVNNFTMEDLLYIAKESSIKESWAKEMIQNIIGVISSFENRAKVLKINDTLVSRVLKALRLDIRTHD